MDIMLALCVLILAFKSRRRILNNREKNDPQKSLDSLFNLFQQHFIKLIAEKKYVFINKTL